MAYKLSRRIWLIFQISFFDSRAFFMRSASFSFCSSVSVRLLYGFFPNLNSKSGHWGAEQDLTALLSHPQHSIQNSFIAINGDVGLSFPFLSLISDSKFQISFSKSNFDFQFLNWIYHIKIDLSIPKFKFQNKKWKSNFWIVYKKIDFEFVVRIYVYRYNTYTHTLTINIYKYNYMNPSIRLQTTPIWLHQFDYNLMTTELRRQPIITNTIYIHIYTYNYIYIITFLQWIYVIPSRFYNQILTSTNQQQKQPYPNDDHIYKTQYKRTLRHQSSINRPTDSERTAILIYIWGEIFLAYNARIWGRFQTGDNARVYLWQNFRFA